METQPLYSGLYTDYYELTMAQGYYLLGMADIPAVFDLYFRTSPFGGAYAVAAGCAEAIEAVLHLSFSDEELSYLSGLGFHQDFLSYLKKFRFTGDIDGCREGEIVFPSIPLLRINAPLLQAQLLESLLLNIINFQTLIATKTMRMVCAASGRPVIDFGLRRAQAQASIAAARAAYIGGAAGTSNTLAAYRYGIPAVGTHAHSWVQGFQTEYEAFSAYARLYPQSTTLLIDTYDTLRSGLPNAISIARELEATGNRLRAVRIDSGDLLMLSKQVRSSLDAAGFSYVRIIASDQLDEYRIADLISHNAPIDLFGIGTRLVCAYDQPALDGVYKLSECNNRPCIKCSNDPSKTNLPSKKKVVRYCTEDGKFYCDVIMFDDEDPKAQERVYDLRFADYSMQLPNHLTSFDLITIPLVRAGRSVADPPPLQDIQAYASQRASLLPEEHKRLTDAAPYPVYVSERLYRLRESLLIRRNNNGE
ncbi:MAG: nicotinate phosphoribosyltransferase [Desulfobacterota bacterium]|nr:nicotinate phosphoribosyltransferase [Thermodesulfobacteriota bacterium]